MRSVPEVMTERIAKEDRSEEWMAAFFSFSMIFHPLITRGFCSRQRTKDMRRAGLLILVSGASAVALLLLVAWYLSSYHVGNGYPVGMMEQMMGNQYAGGAVAPMPTAVWVAVAALFVLIVGGIVGFVYYLAVPEIKSGGEDPITTPAKSRRSETNENWQTVLRTSKPDERKILEVLAAHDGAYLQKFIVKESNLSKLQTHRIVSRFAERGIVTATKSGNTNEIRLAPWLMEDLRNTGQAA